MQTEDTGGGGDGAYGGQNSCVQRRLKRTSRMGAKRTLQKLGENATAVMAAICHSGTCSAANNCGSANNTMPLLNPMVALHMPISQMGGVPRSVFKQTSLVL